MFGRGAEYDFDWASMHKLDADGELAVVEHWTAHWTTQGECYDAASDCAGTVTHSGVVLKAGRRGSLRSLTQAEYDEVNSDGNGRLDRPGKYPDDYFFGGPCIVGGSCPGGPGYTGYRTSDKPTQRLGDVVIDRVSGRIYIGISTQSVLPGGNPDFEPALVAFEPDGEIAWWNRLYEETNDNSTPDQYVDHLAYDYTSDSIVVLARAHGNNVINLWRGNEIDANPSASGFQNQFTGTNGNIHISWLGRFTGADGVLQASTYVAEYNNTTGALGNDLTDPNLAGWPNPNGGWPNVNTTRCNDVDIASDGSVVISCTGRRTITTNDAWQQMVHFDDGSSTWNEFVRVYTPDLSNVTYSTILVGSWDPIAADGTGNTELPAIVPVSGGVVAVGYHQDDGTGVAEGQPIPTSSVLPSWGTDVPTGQTGIVSHFSVPAIP